MYSIVCKKKEEKENRDISYNRSHDKLIDRNYKKKKEKQCDLL